MSVTLRKRKNADGSTSLRLDIYQNGIRTVETLKQLRLAKSSSLIDREHNKGKLRQAEEIAITRAAELQPTNYNMITDLGKKTVITEWMKQFIAGYTKKDIHT